MTTISIFAAVRRDSDGVDWIDTDTITLHPEASLTKVEATARVIPQWSQSNPVQRIAQFRLVEITLQNSADGLPSQS